MKRKYLLVIWGDVEPQLRGPYKTDASRLAAARKIRRINGADDGLFTLDLTAPHYAGMAVECVRASVGSFSGGQMEATNGQ